MERRLRDPKTVCSRLTLFLLVGVILIAGCGKKGAVDLGPNQVGLKFPDGYLIKAEVADTGAKRVAGLSGRESLAADAGMWFVFVDSGEHPIWMLEMRFGIDIVWVDDTLKIVEVAMGVMPEPWADRDHLKRYVNRSLARYVLEVKAGTAKAHKLRAGDTVKLISS